MDVKTFDTLKPEPVDDRTVEHFLLRTGRPLPRVIVLGRELGARCRQVDLLGGNATGFGGARALAAARAEYPGGTYVEGDLPKVPVESNSFDGAWLGAFAGSFPAGGVARALAGVHAALRPGGLLQATLGTDASRFISEIGALDFLLKERDGDSVIFRREY